MRREERVTVQGPVKEQQPDGMSHRGLCRVTGPPLGLCRNGSCTRMSGTMSVIRVTCAGCTTMTRRGEGGGSLGVPRHVS